MLVAEEGLFREKLIKFISLLIMYFLNLFSVERLFFELMGSGHQALDPLIVTPEGILTISEESLQSPRLLCTMLQGHR